jgi:hypothetical protein
VARADGTFRLVAVRLAAVAALTLLAAVVNGWAPLVPVAVALAGGAYAGQLAFDDAPLDVSAPAIAVGLLLAAELAYWSLDERQRIRGEAGESLRRVVFVAVLGVGAFVTGAVVLALADTVRGGGIALDLVGAAAAIAALATILVTAVSGREDSPR